MSDCDALAIATALRQRASRLGLPLTVQHFGSVMGIYFTIEPLLPNGDIPNPETAHCFHLACLNNGVHIGPGGVLALNTAVDDKVLAQVIEGMTDALAQIA